MKRIRNTTEIHVPTFEELQAARQAYEDHIPRDLFYRAALELVDLADGGKTSLSVAEALAVLLQAWNAPYYRFRPFTAQHFEEIDRLVNHHHKALAPFKDQTIESCSARDKLIIKSLFESFESVLGPVGAAKCLHLLAHRFFPLWDRAIAEAYGLTLRERGQNGKVYCSLMDKVKKQCERLGGEKAIGRNSLKALDEYNYCKYTRKWI